MVTYFYSNTLDKIRMSTDLRQFEHYNSSCPSKIMFDLKGKVCLVTGAASGIGLECVKELLKNEVKGVVLVDIDQESGLRILKEISEKFGENKAIFVRADISDQHQFEEAFEESIKTFNHIDVLINNASVFNEDQWQRMVEINLNGSIHGNLLGFEKYIPKYKSGAEGVIINICSTASVNIRGCNPIYTAVKHAVLGLSRSFGVKEHYDRTNVKVISVCPGMTDTTMPLRLGKFCINEHYANMFLKSEPYLFKQPARDVAKSVVDLIKNASTGSVWVAEDSEEPYELQIPSRQEMRKRVV